VHCACKNSIHELKNLLNMTFTAKYISDTGEKSKCIYCRKYNILIIDFCLYSIHINSIFMHIIDIFVTYVLDKSKYYWTFMNIGLILYNNISALIYFIILDQKHIPFKVIHCTSRRHSQFETRYNFDTTVVLRLLIILTLF
jgi:hypothetical protein